MNDVIKNVVHTIKENIDPDKIILFGSQVEHPNVDSDFDICILKSNISHKRLLTQQLYKLLYSLKIAFDLVVDTPEHFEKMQKESSFIYYEIMRTGKVIYEKK
ncbi:MAG TPA: nucleotidyltransferase domain-containing protein [Candidatus Cloacimonadota bacterium]|nr:nucleotidyltransferase domain-containing protein [Candidatus Cloacimonadota bacterium]